MAASDPPLPTASPASPAEFVRTEAAALLSLATRLDGAQGAVFDRAVSLLVGTLRAGHKVVLTGVGKSGLVARKIVATMISTGTQAQFLHPTEALHGDLGLLSRDDILIALSYSGETEELLRVVPLLKKLGVALFSFCGSLDSSLAQASVLTLDVSVAREACALQLAPTASTTTMLALGDALAIELSQRLEFRPTHFAELHPGGHLGRRLMTAAQAMHTGAALPVVAPTANMTEIIHEMSAKRLGMTTVQSHGSLLGVLSDGDLRRLMERNGPYAFHKPAAEIMNPEPRTVAPDVFAPDLLNIMEQHKITALIVTTDGSAAAPVRGVVHLHDLWGSAPAATAPRGDTTAAAPIPPAADGTERVLTGAEIEAKFGVRSGFRAGFETGLNAAAATED